MRGCFKERGREKLVRKGDEQTNLKNKESEKGTFVKRKRGGERRETNEQERNKVR